MKAFWVSFIPHYISNSIVSAVYSFLGWLQFLSPYRRKLKKQNEAHNISAFRSHQPEILDKNGYIEYQGRYTDMFYGKSTMQRSGCGVIAVFNALSFLSRHSSTSLPDLPFLIQHFAGSGMVLNGHGGTAPGFLQRFLTKQGISNRAATHPEKFASLARESHCLILTMFNDRDDIRRQMHTICITKEKEGYLAHNVAGNGTVVGPYSDFSELMNHMNSGKSKIFYLIGCR